MDLARRQYGPDSPPSDCVRISDAASSQSVTVTRRIAASGQLRSLLNRLCRARRRRPRQAAHPLPPKRESRASALHLRGNAELMFFWPRGPGLPHDLPHTDCGLHRIRMDRLGTIHPAHGEFSLSRWGMSPIAPSLVSQCAGRFSCSTAPVIDASDSACSPLTVLQSSLIRTSFAIGKFGVPGPDQGLQ